MPPDPARPILVSVSGSRADIRLNRPEVLNAMSFELFEALAEAVDEVGASDADVCVVSGEGRSFSSGIDVTSLAAQSGPPNELISLAQRGYRKLTALSCPTIAVIQGHALGAGLQLAIACDLRIVARNARMGLLELNYGIIPDLGGSTGLPRSIGAGRAKKMIWTGEQIDGDEAGRIGLAEVVVEATDLGATTDDLAAAIAAAPTGPVREAKALIDASRDLDVQAGFDAEAAAQERCMSDPGFAETMLAGVRKVMQKRSG